MPDKICPSCGKKQDSKNRFCKNCGTFISSENKKTEKNNVRNINGKAQDPVFEDVNEKKKNDLDAFIKDDVKSEIRIEEKISNVKICPECRKKVESRNYCKNCGCKLKQDENSQNNTCSNCGAELSENANFCSKCGISSTGQQSNYTPIRSPVKSNKSPFLALILSFFIPGLGQAYLGLVKKGIKLFIIAIIGGILMSLIIGYILYFIAWFYGMYDGYNSAKKINNNIEVEDNLF